MYIFTFVVDFYKPVLVVAVYRHRLEVVVDIAEWDKVVDLVQLD